MSRIYCTYVYTTTMYIFCVGSCMYVCFVHFPCSCAVVACVVSHISIVSRLSMLFLPPVAVNADDVVPLVGPCGSRTMVHAWSSVHVRRVCGRRVGTTVHNTLGPSPVSRRPHVGTVVIGPNPTNRVPGPWSTCGPRSESHEPRTVC